MLTDMMGSGAMPTLGEDAKSLSYTFAWRFSNFIGGGARRCMRTQHHKQISLDPGTSRAGGRLGHIQ